MKQVNIQLSALLHGLCTPHCPNRTLTDEISLYIVARIAYLSSDVIVSVQPAQSIESEFSSHLHRYAGRGDKSLVAASESGVPEV
jgi:hypothetical protein